MVGRRPFGDVYPSAGAWLCTPCLLLNLQKQASRQAPTDGSELSQKAIDGAIDLAQSVGARITAYACLPQYPYSPFADVAVEPPDDFHARAENEAREHLRAVERAAESAGVPCASVTNQRAA